MMTVAVYHRRFVNALCDALASLYITVSPPVMSNTDSPKTVYIYIYIYIYMYTEEFVTIVLIIMYLKTKI